MAIRVVQGLIDVNRNTSGQSQSVQIAPASQQRSLSTLTTATQQTSTVTPQTVSRAASFAVVQDASVSLIRSRAVNSENKIREPEKAQKMADSVARQLLDDTDTALDAHPDLTSEAARQHFSR